MDWLQFIASVIGSLAWPTAAVVLGFMFREQVRKLLDKMKTLKAPGGIEAAFTEQVSEVAAEVKYIPEPASSAKKENAVATVPYQEQSADDLAGYLVGPIRPTAAILDTWRSIEAYIYELYRAYWHEEPKSGTWLSIVKGFNNFEIFSDELLKIVLDMGRLRNQVAHSRFEPDEDAARDYVSTAQRVLATLAGVRERIVEDEKRGVPKASKR
ncbi:MAG TPA: hypothetical protein VHA82_12375 [Ramlibacter sp.]|uniref:hypothetical protein n=1 Tax=Ramlibacter sp. TaxID=1917967 RepID=UPI002CE399A8|nr:hypothetical protein [Ramlibacter sp.]HVZ44597.1 hypothetical protein [Ramlibacter sp.]